MTGKEKKMNYSELYTIRIDKKLKKKLLRLGSKRIRKFLDEV